MFYVLHVNFRCSVVANFFHKENKMLACTNKVSTHSDANVFQSVKRFTQTIVDYLPENHLKD